MPRSSDTASRSKIDRPGVAHGLPRPSRWIDLPLLALRSLASLGDHLVGLITELRRNLPVRLQHLLGWEDLLAVPGGVGGDLRRLGTAVAALGKLLLDLLRPKTGRIKVLLGIALDLRCSALPCLDLVSEIAELVHQC